MSKDTVISFTPPGQIGAPLTEVLRAGARQLLKQGLRPSWKPSLPPTPSSKPRMAGSGWFDTATGQSAKS